MFAAVFLSLLANSFAAHAGFASTGNVEWKNCGNPADSWFTVNKFDIRPSPIKYPGDVRVDLDSKLTHELNNALSMDVVFEKELLGVAYTKVVCVKGFGTCHYDDPCHFLSSVNGPQGCPKDLSANGLPCICPINAQAIKLTNAKFVINKVPNEWFYYTMGNNYIKVSMTEKATKKVRACFETYLKIQH